MSATPATTRDNPATSKPDSVQSWERLMTYHPLSFSFQIVVRPDMEGISVGETSFPVGTAFANGSIQPRM